MKPFADAVSDALNGKAGKDFFVFVSEDGRMLAVTKEGYEKQVMRLPDALAETHSIGEWANAVLVPDETGRVAFSKNLREDIKRFPLLSSFYMQGANLDRLKCLLSLFNLPDDLRSKFEAGLLVSRVDKTASGVSHEDVMEQSFLEKGMEQAFLPLLKRHNDGVLPTGISDEHVGALMDVFARDDDGEASPQQQAALLLVLSSVFVKYSSSAMFGSEHDSSDALRSYVYALLLKVGQLDPDLIDQAKLADFKSRLMGTEGQDDTVPFTCSSVLFNMMRGFIVEKRGSNSFLRQYYTEVLPLAWH